MPLVDPLAGRLAESSSMVTISIDYVRAALTLVLGDVERAAAITEGAVEASRRRGTVLFLGRELVLLADCRRRLGALDEEVDALLGEALAIAERTGAKLIAQDAARRGLVGPP